jgi:hypothetical protein
MVYLVAINTVFIGGVRYRLWPRLRLILDSLRTIPSLYGPEANNPFPVFPLFHYSPPRRISETS